MRYLLRRLGGRCDVVRGKTYRRSGLAYNTLDTSCPRLYSQGRAKFCEGKALLQDKCVSYLVGLCCSSLAYLLGSPSSQATEPHCMDVRRALVDCSRRCSIPIY